jgi:ribulose 1,5-bisphosphate synthetase/thiazole synthase
MFRCLRAKPALRALGKRFVSHHVAIIGSGPSAFYAARTIAKRDPSVQIDLIEKLPVPFGKIWISRAAFFGWLTIPLQVLFDTESRLTTLK